MFLDWLWSFDFWGLAEDFWLVGENFGGTAEELEVTGLHGKDFGTFGEVGVVS